MSTKASIGLPEALALTLADIAALTPACVPLADAVDRIAAEDLQAKVDSPSVDASLKDGYAVLSQAVAGASPDRPVSLRLAGHAAAGGAPAPVLAPGTTVRVLTGAGIPAGADAVVSEEYTVLQGRSVRFINMAEPGRNVMPRGSDLAAGDPIVRAGDRLAPGRLGLLAAAGHSHVRVVRRPTVAIVATGDELAAPGDPLACGKLYASNLMMLTAWCRRYGMAVRSAIVKDDLAALSDALRSFSATTDCVITSGGAWSGDRDLVGQALRRLGWRQVFHRVRMGPGKAAGFGWLDRTPVFMLPGGPPSNLIGFLQIALPGLLKMGGHPQTGLPTLRVRVVQDLSGRNIDWTHFVFGQVERRPDIPLFSALLQRSRLQALARADAVVALPEGCRQVAAGTLIEAQLLNWM